MKEIVMQQTDKIDYQDVTGRDLIIARINGRLYKLTHELRQPKLYVWQRLNGVDGWWDSGHPSIQSAFRETNNMQQAWVLDDIFEISKLKETI